MYSSSSSRAKKKTNFRKTVGACTVKIWNIYSLYFGYAYSVEDALRNLL